MTLSVSSISTFLCDLESTWPPHRPVTPFSPGDAAHPIALHMFWCCEMSPEHFQSFIAGVNHLLEQPACLQNPGASWCQLCTASL